MSPDGSLDRFRIGDRVVVRDEAPGGNPRTPRYLRNLSGTVLHRHGVVENPLDHTVPYPPLYSVVFPLSDGRSPHDEVLADLHEEWLMEPDDEQPEQHTRP